MKMEKFLIAENHVIMKRGKFLILAENHAIIKRGKFLNTC